MQKIIFKVDAQSLTKEKLDYEVNMGNHYSGEENLKSLDQLLRHSSGLAASARVRQFQSDAEDYGVTLEVPGFADEEEEPTYQRPQVIRKEGLNLSFPETSVPELNDPLILPVVHYFLSRFERMPRYLNDAISETRARFPIVGDSRSPINFFLRNLHSELELTSGKKRKLTEEGREKLQSLYLQGWEPDVHVKTGLPFEYNWDSIAEKFFRW